MTRLLKALKLWKSASWQKETSENVYLNQLQAKSESIVTQIEGFLLRKERYKYQNIGYGINWKCYNKIENDTAEAYSLILFLNSLSFLDETLMISFFCSVAKTKM